MSETLRKIENGDLSVTVTPHFIGDDELHVYASTRILTGDGSAYLGAEVTSPNPVYHEIKGLIAEGDLVLSDDGVIVNVNGEDVYTQYLIPADLV